MGLLAIWEAAENAVRRYRKWNQRKNAERDLR